MVVQRKARTWENMNLKGYGKMHSGIALKDIHDVLHRRMQICEDMWDNRLFNEWEDANA
jgi:hypothetical protein